MDLEPTICTELLDNVELYLECDDDEVNFELPDIPTAATTEVTTTTTTTTKINVSLTFAPSVQHSNSDKFMCCLCCSQFSTEVKFSRHALSEHQLSKPFTCHLCHYVSSSIKLLKQHALKKHKQTLVFDTKVHVGTNPAKQVITYVCSRCDFTTQTEKLLQEHCSTVHAISSEKWLSCSLCNFQCKQRRTLKNHKLTHLPKPGVYVCKECGKEFLTNSILQRHVKIHGAKTFTCPVDQCNKSFKVKSSLTDHVKIVHEQKPKYNRESLKNSTKTSVLVSNKRKFDNKDIQELISEKKAKTTFVCPEEKCLKSFRDNYNLTVHIATHSKEKLHTCPKCDFTYIQKSALDYHWKKCHKQSITSPLNDYKLT